jgi:hypothetical protein
MLLDILTIHGHRKVKSPNNISKWQMGFKSAFKGLIYSEQVSLKPVRMLTTPTDINSAIRKLPKKFL